MEKCAWTAVRKESIPTTGATRYSIQCIGSVRDIGGRGSIPKPMLAITAKHCQVKIVAYQSKRFRNPFTASIMPAQPIRRVNNAYKAYSSRQ